MGEMVWIVYTIDIAQVVDEIGTINRNKTGEKVTRWNAWARRSVPHKDANLP